VLHVGSPWEQLTHFDLDELVTFTDATKAQLREVVGRAVSLPGAKYCRAPFGGHLRQFVLVPVTARTSLEALGLTEVSAGLRWPPEQLGDDEPALLPDGSRRTGPRQLDGVSSARRGRSVLLRWASLFPARVARQQAWVRFGLCEGPFQRELKQQLEEAAQRKAELREAEFERRAEEALARGDAAAFVAAVKAGRLDQHVWARMAASERACFDALLKRMSAPDQRRARNALLDEVPLAEALARGAEVKEAARLVFSAKTPEDVRALAAAGVDLGTYNSYGQTPIHATDDADILLALVECGAPLDLKDHRNQSPVRRFVERLRHATPTITELAVVVEMARRGGRGALIEIAAKTRDWPTMKTHKAAFAWLQRRLPSR